MFRRILAAIFAVLMIFAVGCDNDIVYDDLSEYSGNSEVEEDTHDLSINPLTGVAEYEDSAKAKQRPIAIMIENSTVSMPVQTGLANADIVYETEAEGGITRLVALYQDISDMDKIGNVRSARYPYVDLALGHNAVYVHCGCNVYCKPHLEDIDDIELNTDSTGSKRIANGLASEHTVYALADQLNARINKEFDMTNKNVKSWVNFTDEKITLDGGAATSVSVPFPASKTNFTYDEGSGLYTRLVGSKVHTDYFTDEKTQVKNIFVLLTDMSYFSDNKTRNISFKGGDGYYITNGTVQFIKWEKGAATNGFKFADTEGKEITVSAGNSWVCIANKTSCEPVIE